jgi:hypothetical protein
MIKHLIAASLMLPGIAYAQSTIAPTGAGVNVTAPASGKTENLSVTNGSRTSLSVGNSTSFGTSANLSASGGLTAISRSALSPSDVSITSNIGSNPDAEGVTKINISNLTAKGGGTVIPGNQGGIGSGTTIDSNDGQFASGDATIDGMGASVTMNIGSTPATATSTGSEASFFAIVHPNVVGNACNPSSTQGCAYTDQNGLVSGNAGASANLSTQTNIDIQANSFTQTFAQSF